MKKLHSELLYIANKFLKASGISNSVLEAELLLSFALGVGRESLALVFGVSADYRTTKYFFSLLERRILGEPIAYLTERKDFFSLSFYVNHNVLIPRPETELIVEYMIEKLGGEDLLSSYYLDLCTGSACIINVIAKELSIGALIGGDVDIGALKVASKNAKLCGSGGIFYRSFLFSGVPDFKYRVISCNPPYISDLDIMGLDKGIRYYEPLLALEAGKDGLFFYRRLADALGAYLSRGGFFVVEVGLGQKGDIVFIFQQRGFVLKDIVRDLSGVERVLVFGLL